jgi:hypothetical protein
MSNLKKRIEQFTTHLMDTAEASDDPAQKTAIANAVACLLSIHAPQIQQSVIKRSQRNRRHKEKVKTQRKQEGAVARPDGVLDMDPKGEYKRLWASINKPVPLPVPEQEPASEQESITLSELEERAASRPRDGIRYAPGTLTRDAAGNLVVM